MMRVYLLDPDSDRFHNFAVVDDSASRIHHQFDGRPMLDWEPMRIMAADTDDELAVLGDHALLGTIPVFSQAAANALGDMLRKNGELLPLQYARRPYFAYNVTTVIDCLDRDQSVIKHFSTGRVMSVDKFVFVPELVSELEIFKIPQLPRGFVFVRDAFVDKARSSNLLGLQFTEVWAMN